MNADNQQRSRDLTLEPVREGAAAAHLALRSLVSDLSASEWTVKALYQTERRQSLGMMLGAITGAPRVAPARGVSCDRVGDLMVFAVTEAIDERSVEFTEPERAATFRGKRVQRNTPVWRWLSATWPA